MDKATPIIEDSTDVFWAVWPTGDMDKATHIIEDSTNVFWAVWPTSDIYLSHAWYGVRVKKSKGSFVPVGKARTELVRKAASRVIASIG